MLIRWDGTGKNAANMTVEEFALELQRIKHRTLYIDTTPAGRDAAKRIYGCWRKLCPEAQSIA